MKVGHESALSNSLLVVLHGELMIMPVRNVHDKAVEGIGVHWIERMTVPQVHIESLV